MAYIDGFLVSGKLGFFDLEASANLLKPFTNDDIHLIGEGSRILETLWRIHSEFDRIREDKKKAGEEELSSMSVLCMH